MACHRIAVCLIIVLSVLALTDPVRERKPGS